MQLIEKVTEQRERLVDAFMAQIEDGRLYYESRVENADLRDGARTAFTMLLRQLHGAPITEDDRRITRTLGVRRARCRAQHVMPAVLQLPFDRRCNQRLVFDDQDPHHAPPGESIICITPCAKLTPVAGGRRLEYSRSVAVAKIRSYGSGMVKLILPNSVLSALQSSLYSSA